MSNEPRMNHERTPKEANELLRKYYNLSKENQQLITELIDAAGSRTEDQQEQNGVSFFSFIGWDGNEHFNDLIMYRASVYAKAKKNGLV